MKMSYRHEVNWNPKFIKWIESSVYSKEFNKDKLKPTYTQDFAQWSIAEEAFCAGIRLTLEDEKE
jgi:hypothetical protein